MCTLTKTQQLKNEKDKINNWLKLRNVGIKKEGDFDEKQDGTIFLSPSRKKSGWTILIQKTKTRK